MKTSVRIKCKSHIIEADTFSLLKRLGSNFDVEVISSSVFSLLWDVPEDSDLFSEYHDHHCSLAFSAMLAAINIASLGLFTWHDGANIGPVYARVDADHESEKNYHVVR